VVKWFGWGVERDRRQMLRVLDPFAAARLAVERWPRGYLISTRLPRSCSRTDDDILGESPTAVGCVEVTRLRRGCALRSVARS
jgi:hypothetical protein